MVFPVLSCMVAEAAESGRVSQASASGRLQPGLNEAPPRMPMANFRISPWARKRFETERETTALLGARPIAGNHALSIAGAQKGIGPIGAP